MKVALGVLAVACGVAAATLSSPLWLPDNIRHFAGIPPTLVVFLPGLDGAQGDVLDDVRSRFHDAPDVVQAMSIGIALDPGYPASRVENLDTDLLADVQTSDITVLPDGRKVQTTSSLLSVAVSAGRFDIAELILDRLDVEAGAVRALALDIASRPGLDDPDSRELAFLELYAGRGGSPTIVATGSKDTLAEKLARRDVALLRPFFDAGFSEWDVLDPTVDQLSLLGRLANAQDAQSREALRHLYEMRTR